VPERVLENTIREAQRVHMVGIGGSGMSALASLLLQMGKQVSGSELSPGAATRYLRAEGAVVWETHAADNIGQADYVIRSSAVPADNLEVAEAERRGLPNKKLAEAVGDRGVGDSWRIASIELTEPAKAALAAWRPGDEIGRGARIVCWME